MRADSVPHPHPHPHHQSSFQRRPAHPYGDCERDRVLRNWGRDIGRIRVARFRWPRSRVYRLGGRRWWNGDRARFNVRGSASAPSTGNKQVAKLFRNGGGRIALLESRPDFKGPSSARDFLDGCIRRSGCLVCRHPRRFPAPKIRSDSANRHCGVYGCRTNTFATTIGPVPSPPQPSVSRKTKQPVVPQIWLPIRLHPRIL